MVGILSISGPHVSPECAEVVLAMRRCGINGDVTRNTTVLDGKVENGCRVLVASEPVRENTWKLWQTLQRRCDLCCAHVELNGGNLQSGCVFDVYRPSACPGKTPATTE